LHASKKKSSSFVPKKKGTVNKPSAPKSFVKLLDVAADLSPTEGSQKAVSFTDKTGSEKFYLLVSGYQCEWRLEVGNRW